MHPQTPWAKALESLCLLKLQRLGGRATAHEIAADTGHRIELIAPRMTALKAKGKIRDTGVRMQGSRGRPQVLWACNETTSAKNDRMFANEGRTREIPQPTEAPAPIVAVEDDTPAWFSRYGQ